MLGNESRSDWVLLYLLPSAYSKSLTGALLLPAQSEGLEKSEDLVGDDEYGRYTLWNIGEFANDTKA